MDRRLGGSQNQSRRCEGNCLPLPGIETRPSSSQATYSGLSQPQIYHKDIHILYVYIYITNLSMERRMPSSGMWRRVDFVWTDVSEERIASIFRVEKSTRQEPAWAGGCRLSHQSKTFSYIGTGREGEWATWGISREERGRVCIDGRAEADSGPEPV
jgi:hypothetical protein